LVMLWLLRGLANSLVFIDVIPFNSLIKVFCFDLYLFFTSDGELFMCLAVAGVIVAVTDNHPLRRTARVLFGSIEREINISFVPEAVEGDWILVHAGVAICSAFRDPHDPQFELAKDGE